jgi:hypothetical protein
MAKAEVMPGSPILYLCYTKESKEEDGEGGGDAGVANVEKEVGEGSKEEDGAVGGRDAGVSNLLPE